MLVIPNVRALLALINGEDPPVGTPVDCEALPFCETLR